MWQKLYDQVKDHNFIVIAVAMDSREDAARSWIEEAAPSYPALIDWGHRVAELYNMVNVPQAVWIDEEGRIVRPAENAGAYEAFRSLNFETMTVPEDKAATAAKAKSTYVDAVRDWALSGADSVHAFDSGRARDHTAAPSAGIDG